jgi:hypothetical protein
MTRSQLRTALVKARAKLEAAKEIQMSALAQKTPGPIDAPTDANRMMTAIRLRRAEYSREVEGLESQRKSVGSYSHKGRVKT